MSTVRARALLAAALGGLLLLGTLPVSANAGDPIFLGAFNTAQRSKTTIWANSNQWALRVKQARVGSAALKLETAGGPPMIVNSQAKVTNLNADLLDGVDAGDLRVLSDWCSNDNIQPAGQEWTCEMQIDVPPGGGMLHMAGSVDFYNRNASQTDPYCHFSLDGSILYYSWRTVAVDAYWPGMCASTASHGVPAGLHTVTFSAIPDRAPAPGSPRVEFEHGEAHVIFVPSG